MSAADDRSASGIVLCNDQLRVHVLPDEGARIASFFDTQTNLELLLQPSKPYRWPASLGLWDRFENSACAGIDECLPSIAASGPETPGGPVPDHGDFWRLNWTVIARSGNASVSLQATGYSRPLLFEKHLHLHTSALEIHYRIRNLHDDPIPFLYGLHPLFAIDPGDRIVLPPEVSALLVGYSRLGRLGPPRTLIQWPNHEGVASAPDLSRTQNVAASTADMLFTDRLSSGWCGLYRARIGQGIALRFDTAKLPYLGLWLCYGGWPDDETLPRQYAVAFEPTVAPWGTLSTACENHQAPVLAAHDSFNFSVALERIGALPMTYDEFEARCYEGYPFSHL